MLKEFKEFAVKGNMVDMAVGIIIGAAFGTVIKSLVNDLLMPLISSIFGTPDFSNLFTILRAPTGADVDLTSITAVREAGGGALCYGLFIYALIAFILVALALFFVVRSMNRMKKAKPEPEPEPTGPSEIDLLTEIRDSLKK